MPALTLGNEGILRESTAGQGSQEERLDDGTGVGYANLFGDPGALSGAATASRREVDPAGRPDLREQGRGRLLEQHPDDTRGVASLAAEHLRNLRLIRLGGPDANMAHGDNAAPRRLRRPLPTGIAQRP
jgi:hypothetical protein